MQCGGCGQDNPEGFRFCGRCGSSLEVRDLPEERKVVSILSRARFGTDLTRRHTTPLVGREIDLALLKGTSGPYLATVT
jgi:hypothetical protein